MHLIRGPLVFVFIESHRVAVKNMLLFQLNLNLFKTQQCPYKGTRHNPKKCIYYHSENDRRRLAVLYEMCNKRACDKECNFAHNKVEQLYHPERYKTKYCALFQNVEECDYGIFCSFAHSEQEIQIEKLHEMDFDQDFYIKKFKTVWCPFTFEHNRQHCVYAHNPQDYRRSLCDSKSVQYSSKDCPNWDKFNNVTNYLEGGCSSMFNCGLSHGWKETDYHPDIYKTRQCSESTNCKFSDLDCPFWHSSADRRVKSTLTKTQNLSMYKTPDKKEKKNYLNVIFDRKQSFLSESTQDSEYQKTFKDSLQQLDQLISDNFKFE